MERDGYRCIATGKADAAHPDAQDPFRYLLIGCHIIRRAISIYDSKGDQDAYNSAVTTFDILRNYASLSSDDIQKLEDNIDDPSNGFLLSSDAHIGFDRFQWCLQETEPTAQPLTNKYKVKIYGILHGIGLREGELRIIEFTDHSEEFGNDKGRKRRLKPELPNPQYLKIHAAVAGILHMSGAGKFFDELLRKFGDQDGSPTVRSWEEFERVVDTANLKKGLSVLAVH